MRSVITVPVPVPVRRKQGLAIGVPPDYEFVRVVAVRGSELTVIRWRWYHTLAGQPGRAWRWLRWRRDLALTAAEDAWERWRERKTV